MARHAAVASVQRNAAGALCNLTAGNNGNKRRCGEAAAEDLVREAGREGRTEGGGERDRKTESEIKRGGGETDRQTDRE